MKRVYSKNHVLWDMLMMVFIWVVWTEHNERIFNHKANYVLSLLDCILFFVNFWAGQLAFPNKRKVDVSILSYVRK